MNVVHLELTEAEAEKLEEALICYRDEGGGGEEGWKSELLERVKEKVLAAVAAAGQSKP